jgi:hypothetical protein
MCIFRKVGWSVATAAAPFPEDLRGFRIAMKEGNP